MRTTSRLVVPSSNRRCHFCCFFSTFVEQLSILSYRSSLSYPARYGEAGCTFFFAHDRRGTTSSESRRVNCRDTTRANLRDHSDDTTTGYATDDSIMPRIIRAIVSVIRAFKYNGWYLNCGSSVWPMLGGEQLLAHFLIPRRSKKETPSARQ